MDFDAYKAWRGHHVGSLADNTHERPPLLGSERNQQISNPAVSPRLESADRPFEPPAPYPTSFSQIVELVSTGQSVPGIKQVPDIVLEGQSSNPVLEKRKKPWETEQQA